MRIRSPPSNSPLNSASSALVASSAPLPSPPSNSPSPIDSHSRCEGLDLLALAAIQVAGSRAPGLEKAAVNGFVEEEEEKGSDRESKEERESDGEVGSKPRRRRRQLALPSKYRDSVLQPWKRRTRRRRSAGAGSIGVGKAVF